MQEVKVSLPLVNAVLQYLGTRPYQEVFQLVAELQKQCASQLVEPKVEE